MPSSESRAYRLSVRFQHWDRDHDGHLEWPDLEGAAGRIAEAFDRSADSPERLALTRACRRLWRELARHADSGLDGRIGEKEYLAAFGHGTFDVLYREILEGVVAVAGGRGGLNEAEFVRVMQSWSDLTASDGAVAFHRLDADGDGFLTIEEMVRSGATPYLDDDPTMPLPPGW
jgi:Ca2+-binding EF-hand superfamily protein